MTIYEKKTYLKQYKHLREKIKCLEEELINIRLDALPGGIDYSKDKIQTSPSNDQMINYVAKIEDLEKKLFNIRCESIDVCTEILDTISSLENNLYQTILHRRYILLQTWEEIAYDMNYSTQRLFELHCEALTELNIRENQSN